MAMMFLKTTYQPIESITLATNPAYEFYYLLNSNEDFKVYRTKNCTDGDQPCIETVSYSLTKNLKYENVELKRYKCQFQLVYVIGFFNNKYWVEPVTHFAKRTKYTNQNDKKRYKKLPPLTLMWKQKLKLILKI